MSRAERNAELRARLRAASSRTERLRDDLARRRQAEEQAAAEAGEAQGEYAPTPSSVFTDALRRRLAARTVRLDGDGDDAA